MIDNIWTHYVKEWSALITENQRNIRFFLNDDKNITLLHENFHTELPPQPYVGNINAEHYVLMTNPSYHDFDNYYLGLKKINNESEEIAFKRFNICINQLIFNNDIQFHLLNEIFLNLPNLAGNKKSMYGWWKQRIFCKNPIVNNESNLFILQYFPYRSYHSNLIDKLIKLECAKKSSIYRNKLLIDAICNNKKIYIMRSLKRWIEVVPELYEYGISSNNVFIAKNFQNATLSKSNMIKFKDYYER